MGLGQNNSIQGLLQTNNTVSYLLQVTVFDVPTHLTDLGGSLLVLVAVLSMGMEDWVMARWDWRCL